MNEIFKINDKIIKRIMQQPENARIFLKRILPEQIKKRVDFSSIEIGPTNYVSQEFKEYFADIIIKTKIVSKDGEKLFTDICFIFEHKTEAKTKIFLQFLKYMVQEWQKDSDENIPMRIIIPIKELLIKSKIDGGKIMETLAQKLRAEGKKEGIEEGIRQGLKEGMKEGIEEGEKKGKLETAKRMLNGGVTVEDIVKFTGLSEKEIRSLIN